MVLIREECVGLAGNKLKGKKRGGGESGRVKKRKRQTWRRWIINPEGFSQTSLCIHRETQIEFQSPKRYHGINKQHKQPRERFNQTNKEKTKR